jgi:hypothetical protein
MTATAAVAILRSGTLRRLAVITIGLVLFLIVLVIVAIGSILGDTPSFGPPVNLGAISPPAEIVALDEAVAAAPSNLVACSIPASVLLAQQYIESGYQATVESSAGAIGLSQFEPGTFAEYDQPVPPGGANPPTPTDPVDSAYAEARYLCSLGFDVSPVDALIAYNCGNTSPACQSASMGYATEILQLASTISTPATTTTNVS